MPKIANLDPAQVARFRSDLERIAQGGVDHALIGLAVSGGPDSVAMLALAAAALPDRIRAATVDHGLREGSAQDGQLVADLCRQLGVPHAVLHPSEPIRGSSLQMRARDARYAALAAWARAQGIAAILTAHHADDQAETLLMRLNRAAGIAGLSAIRPACGFGDAVALRPLLGWRRAELHAIVARAGLPFVDDPANRDPRHDRTRFRALLAASPELDPGAFAASAAFLEEAEQALAGAEDTLWAERWRGADRGLEAADLPREFRRRLLRRAIAAARFDHGIARPAFAASANVEPLLDSLDRGQAAVQAGVRVEVRGPAWHFRPAPPRRTG